MKLRGFLVLGLVFCALTSRAEEVGCFVEIIAGETRYSAEIAADKEARAQGLMNRAEMTDDAGMLFLFEADSGHAFWMKNTYIPLDILFYDDQGQLVNAVENAEPLSLDLREGRGSAVLELNAGQYGSHEDDLQKIAFVKEEQGDCSDAEWAMIRAHPIFEAEVMAQ